MTSPLESDLYCSAERHLLKMKSRLAAPLYTWAWRLARKSGVFYPTQARVAEYFGVSRKTVQSALGELVGSGFVEINRTERFTSNTYTIVSHAEWETRHPGRCIEKLSFPWKDQGDPLGRQLYSLSGARMRLWPRQVTGLRNVGFPDEQILEQFAIFFAHAEYAGKQWRDAYYDFLAHLKARRASPSGTVPSRSDTHRAQSNGHDRAQSKPVVVPSRSDTSSRSNFSRGGVEAKQTIPALLPQERLLGSPTLNPEKKEEKRTTGAARAGAL